MIERETLRAHQRAGKARQAALEQREDLLIAIGCDAADDEQLATVGAEARAAARAWFDELMEPTIARPTLDDREAASQHVFDVWRRLDVARSAWLRSKAIEAELLDRVERLEQELEQARRAEAELSARHDEWLQRGNRLKDRFFTALQPATRASRRCCARSCAGRTEPRDRHTRARRTRRAAAVVKCTGDPDPEPPSRRRPSSGVAPW